MIILISTYNYKNLYYISLIKLYPKNKLNPSII